MSCGNRFLFKNGVVSTASDTPPVAAFLETHPGAYTTTRTHNNGSEILFWQRHLRRLSNSFQLLFENNPKLVLQNPEIHSDRFRELSNRKMTWDSLIGCLVNDSMRKVMPFVVNERDFGEELAITTLLSGSVENLEHLESGLDVYLHVGGYVPPNFGVRANAARLAVVGRGRDFASAKYSDWVRLRRGLEKLRPPMVTELLLSNDGERILEGCLTNLFIVCVKEKHRVGNTIEHNELQNLSCIEVQTAPVSDGVLPGILRQVVIDVCLKIGIPVREVAPSWSEREFWSEAFITNGLRILQHVETIKAPSAWKSIESKTWDEITWVEKQFGDPPGKITSLLQKEVLLKADIEAFPFTSFEPNM